MPTQYLDQQPGDDERSLAELFSELSGEVQQLMRKEVELAKVEAKQQVSTAAKAGAMLGGTAVAGIFGALMLSFAAAWALAEVVSAGLAFLAVGLLYLVVTGLVFVQGRKRLSEFSPVPEQTVQTLKEDVEVAKDGLVRGASTQQPWSSRGMS